MARHKKRLSRKKSRLGRLAGAPSGVPVTVAPSLATPAELLRNYGVCFKWAVGQRHWNHNGPLVYASPLVRSSALDTIEGSFLSTSRAMLTSNDPHFPLYPDVRNYVSTPSGRVPLNRLLRHLIQCLNCVRADVETIQAARRFKKAVSALFFD